MRNTLFIAALLLLSASARADVLNVVIDVIHHVESGGATRGVPDGDNGRAIGPFQIHRAYWTDALRFDPSIGGRYEDCRDYAYARRVVEAYLRGYGARWVRTRNVQALCRIHNGGPNGWRRAATLPYWRKCRQVMAGRVP